jgi:hypothetical protein
MAFKKRKPKKEKEKEKNKKKKIPNQHLAASRQTYPQN